MKKTLLAAVLAASFGASAFAATLPSTTESGETLSVVLSGTVDLAGQGAYVYHKDDKDNYNSSNTLGYAGNDASLGLNVSSAFGNGYSAFTNVVVGLGHKDGDDFVYAVPENGLFQLNAKKVVVGFASDDLGTVTVGKQASASDDMAYNGFGDFDINAVADGSSGAVNDFSVKYASPDYDGVSFAASLAANNLTSESNTVAGKTTDKSDYSLNNLSLGVQFANDDVTVAATFDVQKNNGDDFTSLGATLGAGYTLDNLTLFGHLGFSNNGFAGGKDMSNFGVQAGVSVAATDANTVSAAVQYNLSSTKGADHNPYFVGFKVADYHSFNDNFTGYLFTAFNYGSQTGSNVKSSDVALNYGAGLKYEF